MIDQSTLDGKVITAAFDLAASPGWAEVSLRDIADAAGCSLADTMERFSDKDDVLKVFFEHVDRTMLTGAGDVEREQSSRDAVFEVIMSRFDAMAPYRTGLKSILQARQTSLAPDPTFLRMTLKTQNKILQAAGVSSAGAPALLRQLGLARIYGQVVQIWLDDEDAGMARTMAALDKRLRQGEQTLRTIDDVAKSGERACEQATAFASRMILAFRAAAERHDPTADTGSEEGAPPPDTTSASPTGADASDTSPGCSPA